MYEEDDVALGIVRERYRAFTVDEYQDVNLLQQTLLELWLGARDELCVVGDDYQSIYAFTGASPRAPARDAAAVPARDGRPARGELPLDAAGARAREPARAAARRRGEDAARDARGRAGARAASVRRTRRAFVVGAQIRALGVALRGDRGSLPHERAARPTSRRRCTRRASRPRARRSSPASSARSCCGGSTSPADVRRLASATRAGSRARRTSSASASRAAERPRAARRGSRRSSTTLDGPASSRELERRFGDRGEARRGVHLLTLHGAKGLEFEAVFVARVEERELPTRLAKADDEIAEERRLLYVGLTRAKRHLCVTWSGKPSPFLRELGVARAAGAARREPSRDDPIFAALKQWRLERAQCGRRAGIRRLPQLDPRRDRRPQAANRWASSRAFPASARRSSSATATTSWRAGARRSTGRLIQRNSKVACNATTVLAWSAVITDANPFVYSRPIPPEDLIDRDTEAAELLRAAVGGHYVRLYAPRKYGKTSLLRRVLAGGGAQRGDDRDPRRPLRRVVARGHRRAARARLRGAASRRRPRAVEEFLQRTGLGLSLTALGIGVKLQLEPRANPLPALHALLDLPLRLEKDGGLPRADHVRRVPGSRQGALRGRDPAQPHPAPGRGRLVRLRRLGAGADAGAVRREGAPALRAGGADAARPPRRRRHRRVHRRPFRGDEPLGRRVRRAARRDGRRPSAARDAARLPRSGTRSRRADRHAAETGTRRSTRRCSSSSRSSRRAGSGSRRSSTRACAPSSRDAARACGRTCSRGSTRTRPRSAARSAGSRARARSTSSTAAPRSSIRSSRSGSTASRQAPSRADRSRSSICCGSRRTRGRVARRA